MTHFASAAHLASTTLLGWLVEGLLLVGAAGAAGSLPALAAGELEPEAQDDSLATYAGKLTKQEAEIDWTLDAVQLDPRDPFESFDSPLQHPVQKIVAVRQVPFARNAQLQYGLVAERAREDEDPPDVVLGNARPAVGHGQDARL